MFRNNNNIMSLLLYPLRPPISIISTRVETLSNNRNLAKALPVLSLSLSLSFTLLALSLSDTPCTLTGRGGNSAVVVVAGPPGVPLTLLLEFPMGQPAREVRERELYYICGEKVQIDITPVGWRVRANDEATTTGGGAKKPLSNIAKRCRSV